jgi:L-asparaginase
VIPLGARAWLALVLLASGPAVAASDPPRGGRTGAPHVLVLATGGTIASGSDRALSGEELVRQLHLDGRVHIEVKDVASGGSSNLTRADWATLVTAIRAGFADPGVTGIVVTHGTDTMEETAFFLDLVIDEPRPLVVTGSMRSSDAVSADGPANLAEAIIVAADPEAKGLGTMVVLDDQIHAAVAATKSDTNRLSAFVSANAGPLGIVSEARPHFLHRPFAVHPHWRLAPSQIAALPLVEIVAAAFDEDALMLDAAAKGGARAIVVAAFGSGTITAPMRRFVAARAGALPIILSARAPAGFVKQAYGGGSDDETRAAVRSGRLNPGKARVLAMVALAAGSTIDQTLFDAF